jgi:hypothetical protein
MRYDGRTGAFIDAFIAPDSGDLVQPSDLLFQGDRLLVSDAALACCVSMRTAGRPSVSHRSRQRRAEQLPAGDPRSLRRPVRQRPAGRRVLRYDGATGAFLGSFVDTGSGGLGEPTGLDFGSDGDLYVAERVEPAGAALRRGDRRFRRRGR